MGQGRPELTLRVVGPPSKNHRHQSVGILGQGLRSKVVTVVLQPTKNVQTTCWGIEPDTVREASIANGIVRQMQRQSPFTGCGRLKIGPGEGMVSDPVDPSTVGFETLHGRAELFVRFQNLTERADSCGDSSIQFGEDNLQREVDGIQALK